MNYSDLVREVALATGIKQKDIKEVLDVTFDMVSKKILDNEDKIIVGNLGTVRVVPRKERAAVNIATGKRVTIPAGKRVVFKISRDLKKIFE